MKTKEITVDNPFSSDVEYTIQLIHKKSTAENDKKKQKEQKKATTKDKNKKDAKKPNPDENYIIPAWFVKGKDKIQVRRNSSV